jgi:hypothetical protein
MFGGSERRKREMWDEIISYSRRAPEYPSADAFRPVEQEQLDCARRLYGSHRRDVEQLIERAARSDDPLTVSIALWLAVRLDMPRAGQLLDGTIQRLSRGEQHMRPHPVLTAEGGDTVAGLLEALEDLRDEVRRR